MSQLIGRIEEIKILDALLRSKSSEFVAVFGRRRVGKTFLIREFFKNKFVFQCTGLGNSDMQQQLINFYTSIINHSNTSKTINVPKTWFEAFRELIKLIESSKEKKKIIFIDELPWMDTPRSKFLSALEHFWNSWASARKDILLIVCGSSTSWMLGKLINSKGGLHNRVTRKINLLPFTLKECEQFLKVNKIKLNRYQILELYMVLGGIPYYLKGLKPGLSAAQNINSLFFTKNSLLNDEYKNLYASLFKHSENYIAVVEALSKKAKGLTREEIIRFSKLHNGGGTSKILDDLEICGFIKKYVPFQKKNKLSLYQLIDFYSLFYFKFIHKNKTSSNYWLKVLDTPTHRSWSGYAFENICLSHALQIKKELGISGVMSDESSWRSKNKTGGAQIDLLIDRKDQVINICEIKFSIAPFIIDKKYAMELRNKINTFKSETQTRKAVFLTMISTYGTKQNEYYYELVQSDLTMDCLFL